MFLSIYLWKSGLVILVFSVKICDTLNKLIFFLSDQKVYLVTTTANHWTLLRTNVF
jgi:hypothetical protein